MYSDKFSRHAGISVLTAVLATAFFPSSVFAAVKDTDVDGLTDEGEAGIYMTDPAMTDSDSDGIPDGQEVIDGTDPLDASDYFLSDRDLSDPGILGSPEKFPWYLSRAAGFAAFILLTASVVFGLVISSRVFLKIVPGADAFESHRSLSLMSVLAVMLHFGALFFDRSFNITVGETLIPFFFSREGVVGAAGFDLRMPLAFGIVAFYLVVILFLTAEFRARMSPKVWRIVHYSSFAAYPLFVIHGFMSGTDSKEGWAIAMYVVSVALVTALILVRIVSRTILPAIRRIRSASLSE